MECESGAHLLSYIRASLILALPIRILDHWLSRDISRSAPTLAARLPPWPSRPDPCASTIRFPEARPAAPRASSFFSVPWDCGQGCSVSRVCRRRRPSPSPRDCLFHPRIFSFLESASSPTSFTVAVIVAERCFPQAHASSFPLSSEFSQESATKRIR